MKFAFTRRETVESTVWVEAENELAAWSRVLDGSLPDQASDRQLLRAPVLKRQPKADEYDL